MKKSNQISTEKPPKCNYPKCPLMPSTSKSNEKQIKQNSILYKACHYCYTFYCSRECRLLDWNEHKEKSCYYGRLGSCCKKILAKVGRNSELRYELSKIARSAYLSTCQKGFVWLDFSSANEAQQFMIKPLSSNKLSNFLLYFGDNLLPKYVCFKPFDKNKASKFLNKDYVVKQTVHEKVSVKNINEIDDNNETVVSQLFLNRSKHIKNLNGETKIMDDQDFEVFNELCKSYDPFNELILLVSVKINPDDALVSHSMALPRVRSKDNMYVLKFMKMNLYFGKDDKKKPQAETTSDDLPLTLILTSLKSSQSNNAQAGQSDEDRQLFMANLLNEFEMRGIKLRDKYPKIYRDLCLYVEENRPFTPLCLFPRDLNKNNLFMCLIMPDSEPVNCSWFYDTADYEKTSFLIEKSIDSVPFNISQYLRIL